MSGFTANRRRAAALVPPFLLLLTVAGSGYAFLSMRVSRGWVAHTHAVIETGDRVSADLLEAESAERGYLLTGDERYLPPYLFGIGALDRDTARLRQLTVDNASQAQRLNSLGPLVRERLGLLALGVRLRRMGVDTVLSEARLDRGRAVMDSIRAVMTGLQQEEAALLAERMAGEERQVLALGLIFLLGIGVSGLAGYAVNRALTGYARAQRKALAHIEEQNHELQEQAVELELQRDSLEEQATELELLNDQLKERTSLAEEAHSAAELARAEAEELRWRTDAILASISDVFFILDHPAGRVQYANRLARALLGGGHVHGHELAELAPELAARLDAPLRQAAQTRQVIRFDEYYPPTSVYYAAALYPSDTGVSVFLHDVTASHARQAEFKVMTEAMPQLVWSADSGGDVDYWNDRWCAYTGMKMDADLNEHWLTYLHPEDAPVAQRAWDRAVATGEPYEVEYRLRRAGDGEYRWFVSRGLPVRAPDGKILRWFGTSTDIHDERTAAQAIRALSAELKARVDELETMFEVLPIGLGVSHDPACADIRANPALAHLIGADTRENVSKGQSGRSPGYRVFRGGVELPADDLPMQWAARKGKSVVNSEVEIRVGDAEPVHLLASAAPLLDDEGKVRGAIGGFVDVSRRVRAEAEARKLADRTAKLYALSSALTRAATPAQVADVAGEWGRDVLGATATIFLVLKPDGALEALASTGMPREFVGRWRKLPLVRRTPVTEAIQTGAVVSVGSAEERDRAFPGIGWPPGLEAMFAGALRFESRTLGAWAVHFDSARVFEEDDLQLFQAVTTLCAQALERARLFEAERAARESAEQANQAKLKFLRVMSHDLRTPLNAILGYTELLQDGVGGAISDSQGTYLGRIRASTTILRMLIEDILEFARIEAGHVEIRSEDVLVSKLLDGVEALMSEQVRAKGITLVRGRCEAGLLVRADPERARQVLMNLVSNALKFTAAGGEIVLGCEAGPEHVRVTVRDTGIGIPADEIERIFEPFVQAHRPQELGTDQGVGLGLPISRELARAMGGDVTARGEPGVGSVFTLELPRAQIEVPEEPSPVHA